MQENSSFLNELEVTVYHEAGHTVVAQVVGKRIGTISIVLSNTGQAKVLGGQAQHDPGTSIDTKWISLDMDRYILHDQLPPPNADDEYKYYRDNCTITCAGWVTEELLSELMGKNRSTVQSDEIFGDKRKARELLQGFPIHEQEKEMLNAEIRAGEILRNPICWRMVENLAIEIINSILLGRKQKQRDGSRDWYVFVPMELYASFVQTLKPGRNEIQT